MKQYTKKECEDLLETAFKNLEVCDCSLFLASPCGESTLETKVNFIFSSIIKKFCRRYNKKLNLTKKPATNSGFARWREMWWLHVSSSQEK